MPGLCHVIRPHKDWYRVTAGNSPSPFAIMLAKRHCALFLPMATLISSWMHCFAPRIYASIIPIPFIKTRFSLNLCLKSSMAILPIRITFCSEPVSFFLMAKLMKPLCIGMSILGTRKVRRIVLGKQNILTARKTVAWPFPLVVRVNRI